MLIREVLPEEKKAYNEAVSHPLQSWEWGEFRQKTGKEIIRLGFFDKDKIKIGCQLTVHPLGNSPYSIFYLPRGPMPTKEALAALYQLGQKKNAILIKMEPDVSRPISGNAGLEGDKKFLSENGVKPGRPLFTKYTFQLDISRPEEELLAGMRSKTRYNIRLSQKHQVEIIEDNSGKAFGEFIRLAEETAKRQKFYGRSADFYLKMKDILVPAGIEHLFLAKYRGKVLAAYIFFTFKDTLYYPYGASSREFQETMPVYNLFWEAIKFAKKMDLKKFDMWGTPGPDPSPKHPWYGFHHFKQGFGGQLIEFIGTYDLIVNQPLSTFYNLANSIRWTFLRAKSNLNF